VSEPLAGADTRLGKLQRGRGAGWLEAMECPAEARQDVFACVLADPRWDRQVESRSAYYAALILALGGRLEAIDEHLRGLAAAGADEADAWLPLGVLRELARRRDRGAARILDGLATDGPLHEQVRGSLAEEAAPRRTAADRHHELRASLDALPDDRLVSLAEAPTTSEGRIALRLLGARDNSTLVPRAVTRLTARSMDRTARGPEHVAYIRYLEELPAHRVLPLARDWLDSPWPLSLAAECLFARHAEPEDRARVLATAEVAFDSDDMYRLCSMLDALARVPDSTLGPFLGKVCTATAYSYARWRALRVLAQRPTDGTAAPHLREALWDCEPESREVACAVADETSVTTRARLDQLARDEFEDDDVRRAASRP
jgi:hypothetical protein